MYVYKYTKKMFLDSKVGSNLPQIEATILLNKQLAGAPVTQHTSPILPFGPHLLTIFSFIL